LVIELVSKSSLKSAFPQSHSQLVQSGYDIIGSPILGKPFTLIAATTANAVNNAASTTEKAALRTKTT
jgi:hypothetical protein